MINLLHGDCLELMKGIPDNSIDMVLTDPPYLTSVVGGGMFKSRTYGEDIEKLKINNGFEVAIFLERLKCKFKSIDSYNIVAFLSRRQIFDYINFANENKFQYGLTMWHKSNPMPACNNTYLNDVEFAIYIKGKGARIYGDYHSKSLVYKSSINQKDKKKYGHPTIKPIPLLSKYIKNHTKENDLILDPFMGSGSTGVACKNLNRKFIGIEKDDSYFQIATDRINQS